MDSRAGVGSSCFTVPDKSSASPVDLLFAVVHNYSTPGKKAKRKKPESWVQRPCTCIHVEIFGISLPVVKKVGRVRNSFLSSPDLYIRRIRTVSGIVENDQ